MQINRKALKEYNYQLNPQGKQVPKVRQLSRVKKTTTKPMDLEQDVGIENRAPYQKVVAIHSQFQNQVSIRESSPYSGYISGSNEMDLAENYKLTKQSTKQLSQYLSGKFNLRNCSSKGFDIVGSMPKLKERDYPQIGQGASKTVHKIKVARSRLLLSKNDTGSKYVALSKRVVDGKIEELFPKIMKEFRVQYELSKLLNGSEIYPKAYYLGVSENQIITISKLINGGDVHVVLPKLTNHQRLQLMIQFGTKLNSLHERRIVHNDVSLRNMLIHTCQELEKTIYKAYVNDFELATFLEDPLNEAEIISIPCDVGAPERMFALDNLNEAKKKTKARKLDSETLQNLQNEVKIAARYLHSVTKESADVFSFGLMLVRAMLYPEIDTCFDNTPYLEESRAQCKARKMQYLINQNDPTSTILSAIDDDDCAALHKINPVLAKIVCGMVRYDPQSRPTLPQALQALESML